MTPRNKILVLAGETPLPPRSGVRLRVLHLARQLATAFEVEILALGSVSHGSDEPFDLTGVQHDWGRLRPLLRSSTRPYMAEKLASVGAGQLAAGAGATTAQAELPFLVPTALHARAPIVLDAHNVETELLQTLAAGEPNRLRALRWRWEAKKTDRFERAMARAVAAVCTTSEADATTFERWGAREVVVVPNGVDTKTIEYREPSQSSVLVYVGNFGYRPNALAARELVEEVLPALRESHAGATVRLVGASSEEVVDEGSSGVEATGEVESTLPHLHAAGAMIIPLRAGSGTRLKVLEGLAAGVPIIATRLAVAGLHVRDGEHVLLGETPNELAAQTARVLADQALARALSKRGRALVEQNYSWDVVARPLLELHARLGTLR